MLSQSKRSPQPGGDERLKVLPHCRTPGPVRGARGGVGGGGNISWLCTVAVMKSKPG